MRLGFFYVLVSLVVIATEVCPAQSTKDKPKPVPTHIEIAPDELKWGAPPKGLVHGTPSVVNPVPLRCAVLEGDPLKSGVPFTIELGCADGNKVAPHWHPVDENIVVLRGTFAIAAGDIFDPTSTHDLVAGAYAVMPKRMHHFAFCKGDTDLLVYGIGPFMINWIERSTSTSGKTKSRGAIHSFFASIRGKRTCELTYIGRSSYETDRCFAGCSCNVG